MVLFKKYQERKLKKLKKMGMFYYIRLRENYATSIVVRIL